jgi:translation initiation factor IF-1
LGAHQTQFVATVVELLPNVTFRLELEVNRAEVIGHAAGAGKANFVRLRLNDKVLVELAEHDKTRGRIIRVL